MPFLEHLEELRWRIFWSLLAIAVGTGIGIALMFYFPVLDILVAPIREVTGNPDLHLIYLSPADPFFVLIKLGVMVGVILAFPVVAYQIWAFLSPALEKEEKKAIVPALYLGLLLFMAGVAMGYFAALPVTLDFFRAILQESLEANLEINATLGFVTKMLLAFGVVFELPVVIMVLTAMGLVTPQFLRSKRRHAAVILTALASIITPGDVVTLTILMLIPLLALYELSIFLSARIYKRRVEREGPEPEVEPTIGPPPESVEAG
ncbi:MAG: twin-arginine translocase subunit TatC [Gemmatimonadota bacterium]